MSLRPEDEANLLELRAMLGGISDVEAIRRSLSLTHEIVAWIKKQGGDVIFQKGKRRERIRLL